LKKAPKIAVYTPKANLWDDAVTLVINVILEIPLPIYEV
jgi:hypothetical protein